MCVYIPNTHTHLYHIEIISYVCIRNAFSRILLNCTVFEERAYNLCNLCDLCSVVKQIVNVMNHIEMDQTVQ